MDSIRSLSLATVVSSVVRTRGPRRRIAMRASSVFLVLGLAALGLPGAGTDAAEDRGESDLIVASGGKSHAQIIVSPSAGPRERRAAEDLARYVERMSGAKVPVVSERRAIDAALRRDTPLLLVGQEAIRARPELRKTLSRVLKRRPHLRTDGIVLKRDANRIYVAGNNDASHYFAAVELLRHWGCRWFLPTEFGECIPEHDELRVSELNHVHSSPFEIRSYWISWIGDRSGEAEFQARNLLTGRGHMPPTGHALGRYTKGLGKGTFSFPITAPETARHVAAQVETTYRDGGALSLGMEDGSYDCEDAKDEELMKLRWDKYFLRWSVTDPMLELYNNVARILRDRHPDSDGKIGFLAYANMTLPPVRKMVAERSLFCELAPIDIDPIHGMDDPQSPPRREFRDMLYRWAEVMQGRLAIYDYDQGMLVWRDLPNPSHQAFRQDVQHYRKAGVLGVNTESRGAFATTFLNLYLRARLLWNPDEDTDALLEEFYPKFYGPAAEPMREYWSAIYRAWRETIVTEHEYFVAPAIYTPELLKLLRDKLESAENITAGVATRGRELTRNEQLLLRRMEFTRTSYEILDAYMEMVRAAARDVDYATAVAAGERGLKARAAMTALGGIFTTTRLEGDGAPWWPGEVRQYRELLSLTNGTRGELVARLPLEWTFRRDPDRRGLTQGHHVKPPDLSYWNAHKDEYDLDSRKDHPSSRWEVLRTDLYAQAGGIRHPDRQSFTGDLWYRTDVDLDAEELQGAVHLRFPGVFGECWLYVNGEEAAHREQQKLWWRNDYRFEWDVDLTAKLTAGKSTLTLRSSCEHHLGGLFRRPFLYRRLAP